MPQQKHSNANWGIIEGSCTDYVMLLTFIKRATNHAKAGRFSRPAALVCAVLAAVLVAAAVDVKSIIGLAGQRYGARGTQMMSEWSELLTSAKDLSEQEKLQAVNDFMNRRIAFQDDIKVWGTNDYWATPLESLGRGAGDCEDYSIAKYVTLLQLGVPNSKLRLIYVRARMGSSSAAPTQAHMVLGYFENPDDEPVILDNLISSIRPAARRRDLTPVFSFNSDGLWAGAGSDAKGDPTARLSLWRGVLDRMGQDGFNLTPGVVVAKQ